eukprot:TRINITY_DN46947_c0_g1_i1.p1 TRINITY_DN46947_c0_g1~~TRINITY_DN46947_c0_g1_i1.p1  ORF type:complete len:432 (+),score=143.68 TRINITY_DN46947_c0_g1_i1:74-1297(+)
MGRAALLAAVAAAPAALAGHLHVITRGWDGVKVGTMDPATGEMGTFTDLKLPAADEGCVWSIAQGTQGQTATVFYTNGTLFFVGQQRCGDTTKVRNTTLFTAMWQSVRPLARLDDLADGAPGGAANASQQMHIEWDWTCNVVVSMRQAAGKGISYKQVEVSEYDGALYPLPGLQTSEAPACGNCWRQRDGLGALATQGAYGLLESRPGTAVRRARPQEANCGDRCLRYAAEEWWAADQFGRVARTEQRRIVGRGVHNGTVVTNVTDSTRLLTLSPVIVPGYPSQTVLVGLGVCCDLEGCPEQCEGHGGQLSLVYYQGGSFWPEVLAVLEGTKGDDADALRMGVAVDHRYPQTGSTFMPRVSVYASKAVWTYSLTFDKYGSPTAKRISKSPQNPLMDAEPQLWGYLAM